MRRSCGLALAGALAWVLAASSAAGGDPAAPPAEPPAETAAPPAAPPAETAAPPTPTAEPPADGAACAEAAAGRVQSYYDDVQDLAAAFRQTSRSVAFGGAAGPDQLAAGRVEFAKPGKMRWSYTEPEPSEVVSDGSTLWIYDPAAKEVQVLEVGEAFLSAAAIQFLLGSGRILETFSVAARDCAASPLQLVLTPKQPASYERLELHVDPQSGVIARTVVLDLLGNRTEVAFDDLETNRSPPAERFVFQVPEGVRELRLPGR